ncbi:MAG: tRNA (adenosine(37)-N6)-dimethylallyltransferase MiaA [Pseudomonadota bacterium]|nr:tRNA (adenosine(37)-N6)-dimethylallyltransferase MiaA [Pseudomonadota bacterium]
MENKIILISGSTASGKSDFAMKIAKNVGGEIINADSIQIYKDLNILTARPNIKKEDPSHHMYGFLNGDDVWSVGDWIKEAKKISDEILNRKMIPIIVGGTGLYFKAITDGLSPIPDIDPKIRKELIADLKKDGLKKLYSELNKIDPAAGKIINQNDQQRILRALEVYNGTNKKISYFWDIKRVKLFNNPFEKVTITLPREDLYKKCDVRCEEMMRCGAIEEVEELLKKGYNINAPIMNAIGVNEITEFLNNNIDFTEALDLIKYRTHQYAKRQTTWTKHQMITWKSISTQLSDKIVDNFIKKL